MIKKFSCETRNLISNFEEMLDTIEQRMRALKKPIDKYELAYPKQFKNPPMDVDQLFMYVSVYLKWFHLDFLDHLTSKLEDQTCTSILSDYKARLKHYFQDRAKILANSNNDIEHGNHLSVRSKEMLRVVFCVDEAWDREWLQAGDNCHIICCKITSLLACGKDNVRIIGNFQDPFLFIDLVH